MEGEPAPPVKRVRVAMRFCNLCSLLHTLDFFDGCRWSCRAGLLKTISRAAATADESDADSDFYIERIEESV
jgi:hypothetical protein